MPDISVVMAVRNGQRELARTLDSVLAQSGVAFEVVVVDDGSSDATPRILRDFASRDERLRVITQQGTGLTRALIAGCAAARGRYVARQDCGDVSLPERFSRQAALLDAEPEVGFVSCWSRIEGPRGELLFEQHGSIADQEPVRLLGEEGFRTGAPGPTHHGSVVFRRELYERCGGYRAQFRFGQDWDLWLRMAERAAFAGVPEVLYAARLGLDSISLNRKVEQTTFGRFAHESLRQRMRSLSDEHIVGSAEAFSRSLASVPARRIPGAGSYFVGEALRRRGDPRARGYLLNAWRESPLNPKPLVRLAQSLLFDPTARVATPRPSVRRHGSLRILVVCDLPRDPNAGASGTVWQTVDALRRLGHDVESLWGEDLGRRIAHHGVHGVLELPALYRKAVLRALRYDRFDVVQVSQIHGYAAARALRRLDPRPIFVHKSHGLEARVEATVPPQIDALGEDRRPLVRQLGTSMLGAFTARHDRLAALYADGHIVGCTACRDFLVSRLGADSEAVAVIPTAAPEEYLESPRPPMTAERLRRVLFVGQYAFFKAPHRVLEVYEVLARRRPGMEFTWVCAPRHHDEIRARCTPELRGRLRLLDWRDQRDLMAAYDEHGVFLFPTLFEGFSKALIEAMTRGLCIVASDVSGARDLIADGCDGFLCAPHDAIAMAERAMSYGDDPERAFAMSREAAARAEHYTWRAVAERSARFFEFLRARREVEAGRVHASA